MSGAGERKQSLPTLDLRVGGGADSDDVEFAEADKNFIRRAILAASKYIKGAGSTLLKVRAVHELVKSNNIVLVGAPRVGKSTLIGALAAQPVKTAATLSSCTKEVESFDTEFGFRFWDTPGVESWAPADVQAFWDEIFLQKRILPLSILIVVAPGSFTPIEKLSPFLDLAKEYSVQVILVVTKAYALDVDTLNTYYEEFKARLGWKLEDIVDVGMMPHPGRGVSWKVAENFFIAVLNTRPFNGLVRTCGRFGVTNLRNILVHHQSPQTHVDLLRMFVDKAGAFEKAGSIAVDLLYTVGAPVEAVMPDELAADYRRAKGSNESAAAIFNALLKVFQQGMKL